MISGTLSFMRNQLGPITPSNEWSPFVIEDNGVTQYFIVDNVAGIGLVRMVSQEELEATIEVE